MHDYTESQISMHTSRRRPRFAGGAVVSSRAVDVFPQAPAEEKYTTGGATALGVVLALALGLLG
jgi:hypothetical protein